MNKLRRNLTYQILYRILTILTPLITSPYLSRVLGASCLGIFSATYAVANYFILSSTLGVELYGSRSIAVVDDDVEKRTALFWAIYCVQFCAFVISIIFYLFFVLRFGSPERRTISLIQGIWIIAAGLDINWYFFGRQQFKITVVRNTVIKLATIMCVFAFVKAKEDLFLYTLIMSGGMLLSQVVLWFFLLRDIHYKKPKFKNVFVHLKPMLLLFIPLLAASVFHIMDKTMVDILSDEINGGFYYNVDRLVNIPLGLITALSTVMLPRISQLASNNNNVELQETLNKSAELTTFLICGTSFGLGAIAPTFIPFFFGREFIPCISMVVAFVPILVFKAYTNFCNQQFFIPCKKDKAYIVSICSGAMVNVIANYVLIKKYGALGAVFGTFLAEGTVLIIELAYAKNIKMGRTFLKNWYYYICALAMFAFIRLLMMKMHLVGFTGVLLEIFSGGALYCLLALIKWKRDCESVFHDLVSGK